MRPGDHVDADLHLHAIPSLTLRVHLPAGTGSRDISVAYLIGDEEYSASNFSWYEDAGAIVVTGLAPGKYVVELPRPTAMPDSIGVWRAWRHVIDLTGDADMDFTASSADTVFITGDVTAPREAPRHFAIGFSGQHTFFRDAVEVNLDHPQPFTLELPPGDYTVEVEQAAGFFVAAVNAAVDSSVPAVSPRADTPRWSGGRLHIPAGGPVHLRIIVTNRATQVTGVALENQHPASGVMILLLPASSTDIDLIRRDQSDSDGSFTLSNVVPGDYSLLALRNGWNMDWSNPAVLQPYLARALKIAVAPESFSSFKVPVQ